MGWDSVGGTASPTDRQTDSDTQDVSVRLNEKGRHTVRGSEDESASVRPTTLP